MTDSISTPNPRITLRFATAADVALILDFIRALAVYEKLSHEVANDEQLVRRWLFGDRPAAEVVFAHYDDEPAAFAVFFPSYSTFLGRPGIYLEDLFVTPDFRGRGIGKALLVFLARLTTERNAGRLEWSVLDWNEPAIGFYASLGAEAMDGWTTYRLSGTALADLARQHEG